MGRTTSPGERKLAACSAKAARHSPSNVEIGGCPVPEDRLYDLENERLVPPRAVRRARPGRPTRPARLVRRPVPNGLVPAGERPGRARAERRHGGEHPVYGGGTSPAGGDDRRAQSRARRATAALERLPLPDDGWVVRVRAEGAPPVPPWLETAEAIAARLTERIRTQRIRCWPQTPDLELYEIGVECSAVLTMLNEELRGRPPGEALLLVTDDPTSPIEMERWSDQTGHRLLAHRRRATSTSSSSGRRPTPCHGNGPGELGRVPRGASDYGFSIGVRTRFPHSVHEPS